MYAGLGYAMRSAEVRHQGPLVHLPAHKEGILGRGTKSHLGREPLLSGRQQGNEASCWDGGEVSADRE